VLEDRYYMRSSEWRPYRSVTVLLLILNAVIFVAQQIIERYTAFSFSPYFALSSAGLLRGEVWQLLTFQFLHANFLHVLVNSIVIFVFGRALEETLGGRTLLKMYLLSGIMGGLVQLAFGFIWPMYFGGSVVGASAGGFGLVAAYATMFPEQPLTVLLAFIIPVTLRAKYLLLFFGALAVFGLVITDTGVAHAAHLGGLLTGIAYIRWGIQSEGNWLKRSLRSVVKPRELVGASSVKRAAWPRHTPLPGDEPPSADFISREVDPILDKISAQGIHSLTQRERAILEAARNKMGKR
jgi:membrane associated rhomboid family serine protease